MKLRTVIIILVIVSLFGICAYQYFSFNDGKLHIVFCDIGQGDGIYIKTPSGVDMMIDAGPNSSILDCLGRHMPLWDRSIELTFATHPDADHIGGFEYVLKNYNVGSFNTSDKTSGTATFARIRDLIAQKHIPLRFLFFGDSYKTADGVALKDFWPTHEYVANSNIDSDTNSFSLVQVLTYKNFKALFTGDIEKEILNNIFIQGLTLNVFKIPHHGSKTGVDDLTFNLIHAQFIPISVGAHNRYHHPNPDVLSLLEKYKIPYLRTDQVGDIEIVTDGKSTQILEAGK